jgi:hypothetical protein
MTKARDLSNIISGGFTADDIPSLDTAKITTGTFAAARIDNTSLSNVTALPSGVGGIALQAVQTTGFTAVAGKGYPCNTTSAGFTVTLPATPSAGDQVQLVDYAGTFDTNALTINPNSNKIESGTANLFLNGEREGVILTYIDSTQGWLVSSGANEGTDALKPEPYSVDFLVIAGGGGSQGGSYATGSGGGGAGGYRNSFSTEASGGGGSSEASLSFIVGTVYTITVGAGGAAGDSTGSGVTNGANSSISGTGITTITSTGGGKGAAYNASGAGIGGSGGGGSHDFTTGASGTANQGYAGGNCGNTRTGGGGGGASAVGANSTSSNGGNGGAGLASSITGSSVTRAGGGGGGSIDYSTTTTVGAGGTGGGGDGGKSDSGGGSVVNPTAGSANTGGGAGGPTGNGSASGSNGGSGVVILRMPTANYSSTTAGSPTVTTDGTDTILVFNASGSYTG